MSDILGFFLMSWLDPKLLMLTGVGTLAGIYIGAIPGLSVTMAVSILISFTFKWDVNSALALIAGIYFGGVYGGSRSAILLNIPGAPSAIATALDGYPMAKRGEAGQAIGLTTIISVFGGFIGIIALALAAPAVSELALKFAPRDYLMLALWGILLVGSLSGDSLSKGIFAGALGVLIGSVGLDPMTAEARFTFGNLQLTAGISYVAAMIGFFGVSEILAQMHELKLKAVKQNVSKIIPSWSVVRKHLPLATRTSAIGVVVGALPGAGGDIAALMAYDHAKRSVKNPEVPFGEGAVEGLVAPESANNAAIGGAYIPDDDPGHPRRRRDRRDHRRHVHPRPETRAAAHGGNAPPVLVHGRLPDAGQHLPAHLWPDRHQDVRQDRRDTQTHLAALDSGAVRRGRLRDQQQPDRRVLDARFRRARLLPEDVWLPGGPGDPGHHPRTR